MATFGAQRERMVSEQLAARGIVDGRVLEAMRTVPREAFLPTAIATHAYHDGPLPIGQGQTMSQPYVVALMIEALAIDSADYVLEVGTGSGYAAAVAGRIARRVDTVERHRALYEAARARFDQVDCTNVVAHCGDGSRGWPAQAPYDAILVSAGAPDIPPEFREQLVPGGRLVIPIGPTRREQELVRCVRTDDGGFSRRSLGPVRFVPLLGAFGFSAASG